MKNIRKKPLLIAIQVSLIVIFAAFVGGLVASAINYAIDHNSTPSLLGCIFFSLAIAFQVLISMIYIVW